MKRKIILMIVILLLIFAVANQAIALSKSNNDFTPLTADEMRKVILAGTNWMIKAQDIDGHFKYEYAPFLERYIDDDNMVRQAGALYELGEILYRSNSEIQDLKETIINAIAFFEENTVKAQFGEYKFQCLLKDESKCSLGGTSLALIGILDLVEKYPDYRFQYADLIHDYADYIKAMKIKNKGFINNFYLKNTQNFKESPFSNGEAFLALVRYQKFYPTDEVAEILENSWKYFEELYGNEYDAAFYLWAMAAIKDLYAEDPRNEYYEFVRAYTDWRIAGNINKRNSDHNRCAYVEGVASAYSVMHPNLTFEEKMIYMEELNFWLWKHKKFQLTKESTNFSRINSERSYKFNLNQNYNAWGGFLTGFDEPVQRIDFTQHCLSIYLQKLVDIDGEDLINGENVTVH